MKEGVALHLNIFESPLPNGAFGKDWNWPSGSDEAVTIKWAKKLKDLVEKKDFFVFLSQDPKETN